MIARCSRCETLTPVREPEMLCFRCSPPSPEEHARTWLPENYVIKLSAFDVGILAGVLFHRMSDQGGTVPAGVMYLLSKLDRLADDIYGTSAGGSSESKGPAVVVVPAGGSSEPGGDS